MPPKKSKTVVPTPILIESRIHVVRGVRVMLDSDLATLYGVPTIRLNEQVARNRERFPPDFAFQLTPHEVTDLISQNAMSKAGRGGRRTPPWAFTELGVGMASSVLRSEQAIRVNVEIMRAFVHLRRLLTTPGEFIAQLQELAQRVAIHDDKLQVILDVLKQLMTPPTPAPPTRKIGFVDTETQP